jgi:hypothetical protein
MALYGTVPPVVPEIAVDLMAGPRSQKEADQGHLLIWNSHGNLQFVDNPGWKNVEKLVSQRTDSPNISEVCSITATWYTNPQKCFEQMFIQ